MKQHTKMVLVGGWSLVLFAILFVGVTMIVNALAQVQVPLYNMEKHQLFQVTAGNAPIRFFLTIYALLPLLIIPGAVGAYYLFSEKHGAHMRVGMYFATMGAFALTISLLMIPSLNWHLTAYIPTLPEELQATMIIFLKSIHSYFGLFIGDLLGLGCIFVWFLIASSVIFYDNSLPRAVGVVQLIIAIIAMVVLGLRDAGLMPDLYNNVQVAGLMALWFFIYGIAMISLHR